MHQAYSENTSTDHWSPLLVALIVWSPVHDITSGHFLCFYIWAAHASGSADSPRIRPALFIQAQTDARVCVFYVRKHVLLTNQTSVCCVCGCMSSKLSRLPPVSESSNPQGAEETEEAEEALTDKRSSLPVKVLNSSPVEPSGS